jgi:hypothetical protein
VRRLVVHAALYALVLVGLIALLPRGSSFGTDDGAYGGQVFALRQGQWALARPLPVVPEANEGWLNNAITPEGPLPYTINPGYAVTLAGVVRLVHGPVSEGEMAGDLDLGLRVLPVAGALASACLAWVLAARWDRRAGAPAFWLVALGPVLVNATTLWAHTLSSALGGLTVLALVVALERRRAGPGHTHTGRPGALASRGSLVPVALAVGALGVGAVLRTEALLWIGAVAATAVAIDRSRRVVLVTAGGGTVAIALWVTNRLWGRSLRADRLPIETSIEVLNGSPGWAASRFPAAWRLLATSLDQGVGPILTLAALAAIAYALLRLRLAREGERAVALALVAASALYAVRVALAPSAVISGAAGAWPALMFLLTAPWIASRRSATEPALSGVRGTQRRPAVGSHPQDPAVSGTDQPEVPSIRRVALPGTSHGVVPWTHGLLVPAGVLTVALLITQYASSGGLQWGGRYLSFAFVPLGAAAAVGGRPLIERFRWPLTALVLTPAVAGAVATVQLHRVHDGVVAAATPDPPPPVVITEVVALPRIAWARLPTVLYRADATTVDDLLVLLAERGVSPVAVHGLSDVVLDGVAGYRETDTGADGAIRQLILSPTPVVTPSLGAPASDP